MRGLDGTPPVRNGMNKYYTVLYNVMMFCEFGFPHIVESVAVCRDLESAVEVAKHYDGYIEEITEETEVWPVLVSVD